MVSNISGIIRKRKIFTNKVFFSFMRKGSRISWKIFVNSLFFLNTGVVVLVGQASMDYCIDGFHVYQDIWLPVMGETLPGHREDDNSEDRYAITCYKSEVFGHIPQKISHYVHHF